MKCRVCLAGSGSVSLWGSLPLAVRLRRCTGVRINPEDGLPNWLCQECADALTAAYRFRVTARRSDKLLRNTHHISPVKSEPNSPEPTHEDDNSLDYSDTKDDTAPQEEKYDTLECSECGLKVKSKSAMIIHLKKHTVEKPFKCPSCDKSFCVKGTMLNHIKRLHSSNERRFTCEICGKQFIRKKDVMIHVRVHTGETPYSCKYCQKKFSQHATLTRHHRTHTGEKPFPCSVCGKKFADRSMLRTHSMVHDNERKFMCNICGKAVKSNNSLVAHVKLHTNRKCNVCDLCGIAFATKGNLKLHTNKVHSSMSGHCSICSKDFSRLEDHMRKHTGETPFKCHMCGRCFMQKSSLAIHMSNHQNAGKHACTADGCTKTFHIKSMLDFHILKYHKHHKPFSCEVCNRGFFRGSDLSRHLRLSHQDGVKKEK
ncbi:uncharacterized protein LOC143920551 [Arctopsyche grandis]|uniref:uncharacterized protein LOC143920551 n=1 Tax=Arctopsyche grandis TaxID=121162 RepID=UPI00406D6B50